MARRSYGTGSLTVRRDGNGRETWYGRWYIGEQRVNRRVGLKRKDRLRDGLTRPQAERELRRLMESEIHVQPQAGERMTVAEAAKRHIEHLKGLGRKSSTTSDYESIVRVHFEPFFGAKAVQKVGPEDVERFMAAKAREGKSPKSTLHLSDPSSWCFLLRRKAEVVQRKPLPARREAPC